MITIPEYKILFLLNKGIDFIINDLKENVANSTPQLSFLYLLCGDVKIDNFKYYDQLSTILLKPQDDVRKLTIDLMYNIKLDNFPNIYISLPNEVANDNVMQVDQEDNIEIGEDESLRQLHVYSRRTKVNYNIVIVSDSATEVIALYHLIKTMIIGMHDAFSINFGSYPSFENLTIGGQDVSVENDKVPKNIFMRSITLGFKYQAKSLVFNKFQKFNKLVFTGHVKEK